jgi:hypothetical protein
MIGLRASYEAAVNEAVVANKKVIELGTKLEAQVDSVTVQVAELDAKRDELHQVERWLVERRAEADAVRETLETLKANLAALKAGIPS